MGLTNLKFICGAKYGKNIYASCLGFNGLFEIDSENGMTTYIGSFPGESLHCSHLHRNAFIINKRVYFIPYKATNIHVYDISRNAIDEIKMNRNGYSGGYIGEAIGDKILLIPECVGTIVEFAPYSGMMKDIVSGDTLLKKIKDAGESNYCFYRICIYNNRLILPLSKSNIVFEIIISTGMIIQHTLQVENVWGAYKGKHNIWLLADNGNSIYSWNIESNALNEIECQNNYTGTDRCWNWIAEINETVYLLPAYCNSIMLLKDGKFIELESFIPDDNRLQLFFAPIYEGNTIYLLPMGINELLWIEEKTTNKTPVQKMNSELELYKDICRAYTLHSSKQLLDENKVIGLAEYIDGLIFL